jgi:hypothetical protein
MPCDGCEGRSSRATSNGTTGRGLKRAWASRVCQCQVKGLLLYFAAGLGRRRCSGGGIDSACGGEECWRDRETDSQTEIDVADRRKQPGTSSYNTNQSNQKAISICRPSIGRVQRAAVVMHGRV